MLEKKSVASDELAFAINFSMSYPDNRGLQITTAIAQNCSDSDFKKLLKRISDAAEYLDHGYRARALKVQLDRTQIELENCRQQHANIQQRDREVFTESSKNGRFKANGQQRAAYQNFEKTEIRLQDMIKNLKLEIRDLEKITAAAERDLEI